MIMYNSLRERQSNIVTSNDLEKITRDTLEQIADTVGVTLGPYGYSVLIEEPTVGHYTTKDGFSVMTRLEFDGNIAGVIHNLVTRISEKLVNKVGDGSTSSVIIATVLYNNLMEIIKNENVRPKAIIDALEEISKTVNKDILKMAVPISEDLSELRDIATVSLNNDRNMGELISNAYKELGTTDGFINVKIGKREKTTFECVKGFQIDKGYMDQIMVNNPETKECVFDNPKILMFDVGLHDQKYIDILHNLVIGAMNKKENLVVILPGCGKNVRVWLSAIYREIVKTGQPIRVCFIELQNATESAYAAYEDLAIKVGARIVQTMEDEDTKIDWEWDKLVDTYFGSADSFVGAENNSTFIGSKGNEVLIQSRINDIKKQLENSTTEDVIMSADTYRIKKRLAVLTDKLGTIYVGGITEQAKIADKALIDDGVAACKSALKYGYIPGGNVALVTSLLKIAVNSRANTLKRKVALATLEASLAGYQRVLDNAKIDENPMEEIVRATLNKEISLDEGVMELMSMDLDIVNDAHKVDVINSAETDIEIMKAISSIIGLVITSSVAITKHRLSMYNSDEESK